LDPLVAKITKTTVAHSTPYYLQLQLR